MFALSLVTAIRVNPDPALVTSVLSWVPAPMTRSPPAVGVMFPEEGEALEPAAPAEASSGAAVFAPENSAAITDSSLAPEAVLKVIEFVPPVTFRA